MGHRKVATNRKKYKGRVETKPTPYGKGVFARKQLLAGKVIGEVCGTLVDDPDYGSDHCMDLGEDLVLEPAPPFRFLNHSCDPNCVLSLVEVDAERDDEYGWTGGKKGDRKATPEKYRRTVDARIYVEATRNIEPGEQLTIDYAWPAAVAIPCLCGSIHCRGWIVADDERDKMRPAGGDDNASFIISA